MGFLETRTRSFPASSALAKNLRVKISSSVLALAGAADAELGTLDDAVLTGQESGTVVLRSAQGTVLMVANGAISAQGGVYAAASGKVASSGSILLAIALTAATADGGVIECLRVPQLQNTQTLTPAAADGTGNSILPSVTKVDVGAVTTDANDWITLPAIASVPIGHQIIIAANAGTNFEMRTPAASNTKINDVDSDGSQEYLCTDTHLIIVTKRTTTGWVAQSLTKLGAVVTAVIPD